MLISEIVRENRGRFPVEEGIELRIKVLNPSFLAIATGALGLRLLVLSDGFGALEGLAAFFTAILVGRHLFPPHFRSNASNEIPLP